PQRAIFSPTRDPYNIFLPDEAHMVAPQGFNALLKIVEEPPEHIKFIFATTEPEKVIGTIRSRTHHYPFRLVPPAQLLEYVTQLAESESVEVAAGGLPQGARARGGRGRAPLPPPAPRPPRRRGSSASRSSQRARASRARRACCPWWFAPAAVPFATPCRCSTSSSPGLTGRRWRTSAPSLCSATPTVRCSVTLSTRSLLGM